MRYRTIVADPPWPLAWAAGGTRRAGGWGIDRNGKSRAHIKKPMPYRTMPLESIEALPVASLAEPDAHLYLWIPDRFLIDGWGARVLRAWGFTPGRVLIWHKPNFGLGVFPRPQHEALVLGKRGSLDYRVRNVGSVQRWPNPRSGPHAVKLHSAKPEHALDLIEQASPGPYVELFARRHRLGWDVWGDESANTAQLEAAV